MADDSELIGQDEIEALLKQAKGSAVAPPAGQASAITGSANTGAVPRGETDSLANGGGGAVTRPQLAAAAVSASAPRGTATAPAMPASTSARAGGGTTSSHGATEASIDSASDDIQMLLEQAEQAIASVNDPSPPHAGIQAFQFRDLVGSPPSNEKATIDLLRDVELDLKIELGRTHMELEELLKLRRGSVVSLDKLAGDPVDVYVNGRLIARGEVLVLNDNFCVRVAELISGFD
jgi:flagellar motor switch protein FliN/FliY